MCVVSCRAIELELELGYMCLNDVVVGRGRTPPLYKLLDPALDRGCVPKVSYVNPEVPL